MRHIYHMIPMAQRRRSVTGRLLLTILALCAFLGGASADELTVYDGTVTNNQVPAYVFYFDDFTRTQTVFPAGDLEEMAGDTITGIKFYTTGSNIPYTTASEVDVYLTEVDYTSISAFVKTSSCTTVYHGTLSFVPDGSGGGIVSIELDTPYDYGGGNLLIGIENTTDAGYKNINFYGQTVNGASVGGSNASDLSSVSANQRNFIPKTTFTYSVNGVPCRTPKALVADNVTAHSADFTWTSEAGNYKFEYKADSDEDWTVVSLTTDTYTLGNLQSETTYSARVKAVCGENMESSYNTVRFTTIIACPAPTGLTARVTPGDGSVATLSWTEPGEATDWTVEYSTADDFTDASSVNASGTPSCDLTGLTPETTYYARVKAVCGGEDGASIWSNTVTFTPTDAYAITLNNDNTTTNSNIPIYGQYVDWGYRSQFILPATDLAQLQWASLEKLTLYATQNTSSFRGAKFNVYLAEVAYPAFAGNAFEDWDDLSIVYSDTVSIKDNMMEIVFNTPYTYMGGNLLIGFQETDYSTSTVSCTWVGTSQTEATALDQKAGSSHEWGNTLTSEKFLPKVTIAFTPGTEPSCIPPTGFALDVSSITAEGATISWDAGGSETDWQICLNDDEDNLIEVNTNSYTFTGLNGNTTYTAKVRSKCSDDDQSSWTYKVSFTTDCGAINLSQADFSENFDSYIGVTWAVSNNLPTCWHYINTGTANSAYPVIFNSSGDSHSGDNHLKFSSSYTALSGSPTTAEDQYAILPQMYHLDGKLLTLFAKGLNDNSSFTVGVMTNPTDATTFIPIETTSPTTSYEEYSYILNGQGNYVAIKMEAANSSATTRIVYIDDITIADPPTCVKPYGMELVSATTTTATLSWTNGAEGQDAWQIAYSTDPAFKPGDVTPIDVTENPYTITGLASGTTYYAYVRANCGGGDYSGWSNHYCMFATECTTITTFPVSYGFETSEGFPANAATPTTNQLGPCWSTDAMDGNGSYSTRVWGTSASRYHKGSQSLVLPDKGSSTNYSQTMLVFPEMNFSSERGYIVSFWIHRGGTSSTPEGFKVYISDVDYIGDHAVELGHYSRNYAQPYPQAETASDWYQYEIEITPETMTGNVYLIFLGQSYYGNPTYVDDILVKEIPTCFAPTQLYVDNITVNSAEVSWTAGASETEWTVYYKKVTDESYTSVSVNNTSCILENLDAASRYECYVVSNCSADDASEPSETCYFITDCIPYTITAVTPYTEDFEEPVVTSTYTDDGEVPSCWGAYIANSNIRFPHILAASADYNYATSGQVLYFYGHGASYAALPMFYNNLNTLYISFKWATESKSNGTLTLGYITDEDIDYNTFTEIKSYPASNDSYHNMNEETVGLSSLPGNATRLVFRWNYNSQWGCNVDDVKVALIPDVTLADNADDNSTTISDNDGNLVNVTLQGRTLWKDGNWNTLYLPFGLTEEQVETLLENPSALMTLDVLSTDDDGPALTRLDGTTLYLYFEDATEISPRVPYIIKWDDGENLVNPVFSGVTIDANALVPVFTFEGGEFKGTFDHIQYTDTNTSILFLGDNNTLYYPEPDLTDSSNPVYPNIGAFRAYFELTDPSNPAKSFVLNFGDETDGVEEIVNSKSSNSKSLGAWYDLSGRKIGDSSSITRHSSLPKGVYIHNGRKVIIK